MATAFNLVDYRKVEDAQRPRVRIVEPPLAVETAASSGNPHAQPVAEPTPATDHRPKPPSWLVAPPVRAEQLWGVNEPQAPYRAAPAAPAEGPYRSVREVPRPGR